MSEPAEATGAAQGGLGTCGQCGWHGELFECGGCGVRFCLAHLRPHQSACTLALDILVREARERVICGGLRVARVEREGQDSDSGGGRTS